MKVSFKGDGDHVETTTYGQTFKVGEWVEVEGEVAERLGTNPMFDAKGVAAEAAPDAPDLGDLRAQLDALGVKYHPKAGVAKLAALLAAEQAASEDPAEDPAE